MEERALVLLRRKLEALNYTEPLDLASAALVSHLVGDLIRTTDSYRSVKLQASKYAQDISRFNTKVIAPVVPAMAHCLQQLQLLLMLVCWFMCSKHSTFDCNASVACKTICCYL